MADDKKEEKKDVKETLVDQAVAAAAELKLQVEALKVQNDRAEALQARDLLSGKSETGQEPKKEVEMTPKEYSDKAIAGDYNKKEEPAKT